jgi:aminoglycoside phosphotransferase (APT) family kinase protein
MSKQCRGTEHLQARKNSFHLGFACEAGGAKLGNPKMHDDEFAISEPLVHQLVAGQFPQWKDLAIKSVSSSGTDNALFLLGDEMVVRLPRIHWAVGDVEKESQFLPLLAPLLPFEVPVPVGKGAPAHGYPSNWSIYPWLKGNNPIVGSIGDPELLATDLAKFINALHSIDSSNGPVAERGVALQDRDSGTRTAIDELDGQIDKSSVELAWQVALNASVWTKPPVWIHGDLAPGNILLVADRLSAVIDFGALGVGDPACDLIVAWNLLPANVRNIFRSAVNVDEATWMRGRGWALSISLIQLPYYQNRNPELAANARYVINEILREQLGN